MVPEAGHHSGLRVILVGATGFDATLRHDPEVELIRARTPLDALGELGDPIDDQSPSRAVVIVDPDAEPEGAGAGDLAEFLAGLRRVDPDVRILRVDRPGHDSALGYDGVIDPSSDTAGIRRFIQNGSPASHQAIEPKPAAVPPESLSIPEANPEPTPEPEPERNPETEPATESLAAPETAAEPPHKAELCAGDELALLRRIMDGEPVLCPALASLGERLGCEDLEYVPAGESPTDEGPHSAARVRIGEETIGTLVSATLSPAQLGEAAAWLAAWLEVERRQSELLDAALRDPLTGAWNRRYFSEFLPEAIEHALQHRYDLTVLLFDIDDFKHFNDEHGHAAGDEILVECVRMLNSAVRPTDKVCRIGGDEFAVIFHEPQGPREPDSRHPTSVSTIAERFRRLVCEARFSKLGDDAPGQLTISGGLATCPWDGRTAQELIERADQLAMEGKRQGKNVIAIGPCRSTRRG